MSDKFDVFVDSQRITNQLTSEAINRLTDVVSDLEKETVEHNLFIRNATWILRALSLSFLLAAGSLVWQSVKEDNSITKDDIMMIVKAVKSSND